MTLATRCSACGTSFRVVQDQLKVSGGWVRCGRCNEVFNAIQGLYEVGSPMAEPAVSRPADPVTMPDAQLASSETIGASQTTVKPEPHDVPPEPKPKPRPKLKLKPKPAPAPPVPTPAPEPSRAATPTAPNFTLVSSADSQKPAPVEVDIPIGQAPAPPPAVPEESSGDGRHGTRMSTDAPAPDRAVDVIVVGPDDVVDSHVPSELIGPTAVPDAENWLEPTSADEWRSGDWPMREPTPSFIVAAERAARWRSPRVRWAWRTACALMLLTLAAQTTVAYRDVVATRWPASRAALAQVCDWLGCRIEPLRHIAALSVEASGLQQIGNSPVYTLSVGLRNRSDMELMMPAIDVVLTDSTGGTIARRVLTMAELGRPSRSLAPRAELTGQVTLSTSSQRVSGYTIEIFYP
jgi:predicted Zn finger-like uncharacterized protein